MEKNKSKSYKRHRYYSRMDVDSALKEAACIAYIESMRGLELHTICARVLIGGENIELTPELLYILFDTFGSPSKVAG